MVRIGCHGWRILGVFVEVEWAGWIEMNVRVEMMEMEMKIKTNLDSLPLNLPLNRAIELNLG